MVMDKLWVQMVGYSIPEGLPDFPENCEQRQVDEEWRCAPFDPHGCFQNPAINQNLQLNHTCKDDQIQLIPVHFSGKSEVVDSLQ